MNIDDLLLGLTQHWSRDRSVFPTEDDRLDVPTIMLFQAYTACRPAELVDGTKRRGTEDRLLDDSDVEDTKCSRRTVCGHRSLDHSGVMNHKQEDSTVKLPSDSESTSDSEFEDFTFSSSDEDGGDSDGDDRSDTEYNDDDKEDTDMLHAAQESPHIGDIVEEDTEEELTRRHKALCYEDIVLWIVKDRNSGGRDVLAMEVFFRYHKGVDNKPKPYVFISLKCRCYFAYMLHRTVFVFRENPLPILCPISHFLARAIRDKAIDVEGFSHAAPFFSTVIGRRATKVNWKTSMLKTPVFRRSVRSTAGGWEKSATDPMKYSAYAFYLDRIGSDLGSEEKWTSYCLRRGHANALLKVAPGSVVDQVMRHDPMTGCLQNAYLNQRVGFNTQDAYLERDPSADGLTKAFSHMSIRCNPEVPRDIPKAELAKLPPDPEVEQLTREVKQTASQLRQQYGFIKSAPKLARTKYLQIRSDLRNTEKAFRDDMTKAYQEAYRRRMYNEELEKQLNGMAIEENVEPAVEHQLSERTHLQSILCDFNTDMNPEDITARKIRAIDSMVRLAACREARRPRSVPSHEASKECSPEVADAEQAPKLEPFEDFPLLLEKTQCIYCVGDAQLPYAARIRKFKRVSHMMDHVENVHLRHEKGKAKFVCRHPECRHLGDFLTSLDHFKNHVQTVHGIRLRK